MLSDKEREKQKKARLSRNTAVFERHNDKARKRRERRDDVERDWSKERSPDPMVPYTRDGDTDSRPVALEGPPVRRAYLHEYGFTRRERRRGIAAWRRGQRQKARRHNTIEFWRVFKLQRLTNEEA